MLGKVYRMELIGRSWAKRGLSYLSLINDKFLGAVERGQQAASLDTIQKIAAGLGVEIYELFVCRDLSVRDLRARATLLLKEAGAEELKRVVAVLEAMLH